MTLTHNEPIKAFMYPVTTNPSTKDATKRNSVALSTKMNKPSVSIVIGSVKITKSGRTTAFIQPRKKAAISAE